MAERTQRSQINLVRTLFYLALLLPVLAVALGAGLKIRRDIWTYTDGAHFRGDINNAFQWGHLAEENGLFHLYDADEAANPEGTAADRGEVFDLPGRKTDYPPLRLTVAHAWYQWAHARFPDADVWQDDYNFTYPLLWANTTAEITAAVLTFLLIRLWRIRRVNPDTATWWRNRLRIDLPALFGALLLWFNPAVIWDGHCWPQWDIWPVPFFLAAVLLASLDWWAAAGACVAIGASLKGQMLLAAPIMLLWPIFRGNFSAALKLLSGFLLTCIGIALPWMLPSSGAIRWLIAIGLVLVCLSPPLAGLRKKFWYLDLILLPVALLAAWPWGAVTTTLRFVVLLMIAFALALRYLIRRIWWPSLGIVAAAAIFLVMPLFNGSSSWYRLGWVYGTEKFGDMVTGSGAYNLPRMLMVYIQWPQRTDDPVSIPFVSTPITFTQLTRYVYFFCLFLCGIGAAMHDRRRDTRFLVAMTAPWLLFFVILTQMHGRYTIWAAALVPLLAAQGVGLALLGVIVSVVGTMGIIQNQLLFVPDWSPDTLQYLRDMDPGIGFLLLLIAAILLWITITPGSRPVRTATKTEPAPAAAPALV